MSGGTAQNPLSEKNWNIYGALPNRLHIASLFLSSTMTIAPLPYSSYSSEYVRILATRQPAVNPTPTLKSLSEASAAGRLPISVSRPSMEHRALVLSDDTNAVSSIVRLIFRYVS